jgi:hypothetical protein
MTNFLKTTYTAFTAGKDCATSTDAANVANSDAACAAACDALLSWAVTSGVPNVATPPSGTTYCFGYQFIGGTNECKL